MGDSGNLWLVIVLLGAAFAGAAALAWRLAAARKALEREAIVLRVGAAAQADEAARLRAQAPVALISWRKGGRATIDARAREWLALPPGDCAREDLVATLAGDDRHLLLAAVVALENEGTGFSLSPATSGNRLRWTGTRSGPDCNLWLIEIGSIVEPLEQAAQHALGTAASLAQLLEYLPYPVWRRGADLGIAWCNPAFAQIYDMPVERIIAEQREINAAARALSRRARRVGLAQSESQQLVVKGERRLYDLTEMPLPDGSVIGYALDQTQLEESHSELARHIGAHDDVLQALGTGIVIFGPDRRVKFFNAAFRDLFSLDAGFLRQEPTIDQVLDMLRERRQIPEQADFRSFRQEWSRQVMSVIAPLEDLMHVPSGATYRMIAAPHPFGGVILTFEDVTDRLALERNYNTLIEVQRETIDHLFEGIAVFGGDARLKLYNPAFVRLWDLQTELVEAEPHVRSIVDAIKPFFETHANWEELRHRIVTEIGEREVRNWRLERVDGKIIDIAAIPLADGGRLFKYSDVTDNINMERALTERNEALVAADRLKSEFIANVSYEFRTPLNAIIGYAELLARQYFGEMNERQQEYASAILDSAQNLILMIGDVIDVAAIEAGYIHLDPAMVDIRQLADSISRLFKQRAQSRGIDLLVDIPDDIGVIRADPQRLKQALANLLSAAIGAAPAGRAIVVSAQRHAVDLDLSVAVRGPADEYGVNSEGSQARSSTRGLGVALARTLIELHGGRLATDTGPTGRRIVCTLPISPAMAGGDAIRPVGG